MCSEMDETKNQGGWRVFEPEREPVSKAISRKRCQRKQDKAKDEKRRVGFRILYGRQVWFRPKLLYFESLTELADGLVREQLNELGENFGGCVERPRFRIYTLLLATRLHQSLEQVAMILHRSQRYRKNVAVIFLLFCGSQFERYKNIQPSSLSIHLHNPLAHPINLSPSASGMRLRT